MYISKINYLLMSPSSGTIPLCNHVIMTPAHDVLITSGPTQITPTLNTNYFRSQILNTNYFRSQTNGIDYSCEYQDTANFRLCYMRVVQYYQIYSIGTIREFRNVDFSFVVSGSERTFTFCKIY